MSLTKVSYSMINGASVNVLDFGAKGDGVTDDTVSFLAAAATGRAVRCPDGNYIVGDCVVPTGLSLFSDAAFEVGGHTSGKVTITIKPGASRIFKIGNLASHQIGVNIRGINFYGNDQTVTDLVRVEGASFVYIQGNTFNNCNGSALALQKVWEGACQLNSFRQVGGPDTKPAIYLDNYYTASLNNVNNFRITDNTFGSISGGCIGSGTTPNLDLIYIERNKFEWDTTYTWPNTVATPVVHLAQPTRTIISGNGFANYKAANNEYSTLIKISGTSAGDVDISGNNITGSEGIFLDHQGTCAVNTCSPNYYIYTGSAVLTVQTSTAYSISGDTLRAGNTNGSYARALERGPFTPRQFYPSTDVYSTTSRVLVVDSSALSPNKLVKSVTSGGTFDVFMVEPIGTLFDSPEVTTVTVAVRVKAPALNDTSVQLYIDATGYTSTAVAAGGWVWVTWAVTKSTLTASSSAKVYCTDVDGCLFDGFMVYTA